MTSKREAATAHPKTPFEAFRLVCYEYGVQGLARELGLKVGTLYNKADADAESHNQPTLRDVMLVTRLTNDHRILDALEEMFGRAAFDVSEMRGKSDEDLLHLLTQVGKESGEFHTALQRALADRKFTRQELLRVQAEAFDIVSALMTLLVRLEGLIDE